MKKAKLMPWLLGATAAFAVMLVCVWGLFFDGAATAGSIVIICLSLATGLILPNPFSLVFLIAGICMLIFPARVVGLVLLVLGIALGVINAIVCTAGSKLHTS